MIITALGIKSKGFTMVTCPCGLTLASLSTPGASFFMLFIGLHYDGILSVSGTYKLILAPGPLPLLSPLPVTLFSHITKCLAPSHDPRFYFKFPFTSPLPQ